MIKYDFVKTLSIKFIKKKSLVVCSFNILEIIFLSIYKSVKIYLLDERYGISFK